MDPDPCSLIMPSNYSGHDPACICHVETIQMDSLDSSIHLCATNYCLCSG